MATEQNCTRTLLQNQYSFEDDKGKWKPSSVATDLTLSGGFDCSICLDSVQDPVVTFCGHLYCWPCIYEWIRQQSNSPELPEGQEPQCPVCKTEVSERTLIPLYGRGQSMTGSNTKVTGLSPVIPSRPKGPSCGIHTSVATSPTTTSPLLAQQETYHHHHRHPPYHGGYGYTAAAPAISLASSTTFHPVISMFGDLLCARLSGNPQTFHSYPNSYSAATARNSRSRRRVMQADRSLSRLSFFFFCCLVLCLLLF